MFNTQNNHQALLSTLISLLPTNFTAACEQIRRTIVPHLVGCDDEILTYSIQSIARHTNASSEEAVAKVIIQYLSTRTAVSCSVEKTSASIDPTAPSTYEMADRIARNPTLFRSMIDTVEQLGPVGERRNIGITQTIVTSRLLPLDDRGKPQTLALKNGGPPGTGKTHTTESCLRIQPPTAYHKITSASPKSLYNIGNGLEHKALIMVEAEALVTRNGKDTELALSTRSLLSEGQLTYSRTEMIDKQPKTVSRTVKGPISLITTTIRSHLEPQLGDRMFTTHPNISSEQTVRILRQSAAAAAGKAIQVDEQSIEAWQLFHDLLESLEVVVPFAVAITAFLTTNSQLPASLIRAQNGILYGIKTVALMHQAQRRHDAQGRLIAEMADYAIVYQLLAPSFVERIGGTNRYTDERIAFIAAAGVVTPRAISQHFNITKPSVSNWLAPLIDEGVLAWCDGQGADFAHIRNLEKAKRSGKAYLRIVNRIGLPTPFELTDDPCWAEGGSLFQLYDLHLDDDDYVINREDSIAVSLLAENEGMWVGNHASALLECDDDQDVQGRMNLYAQ